MKGRGDKHLFVHIISPMRQSMSHTPSRRRPTLGACLGAPRALRTLVNSVTSRRSIPLTIPEPNENLTKIHIDEDKYGLNPGPTSIHTHPYFTANIDTDGIITTGTNKTPKCPPQPLSPPPPPPQPLPPRSIPKVKTACSLTASPPTTGTSATRSTATATP